MRRSFVYFGVAVGLSILALAVFSYVVAPAWKDQPGGFLATLGEAAKAVIPLAGALVAAIKGLKELQKEKEGKATQAIEIKGKVTGSAVALGGEGAQIDQQLGGVRVGVASEVVGTKTEFNVGQMIEHADVVYAGAPPAEKAELVQLSRFTIHPPPKDFVGREAELKELLEGFERGATITGVTGGGGVGKTVLAQALAERLSERFPDGRLEINLQGTGQNPLTTVDAMRTLLGPFYVGQALPAEEGELRGLYIDTFRKHTCLLLLDNARDAQQVRGLLPQRPSAAIVTARANISLGAEGLRPLRLEVLSQAEARELLREVGPRLEVEAEEALDQLAELCGRLPLALRVAGALLESRKDWTVEGFLERLGDERRRLEALVDPEDPDLNVEAALGLSYESLEEELKGKYRLLGAFPAPFELEAAAAVWGCEEAEADRSMGMLAHRNLVEWQEQTREYGLHDLTRVHALGKLCLDEEERRQALERHAWYYLEEGSKADDEYRRGGEQVLAGINRFRRVWVHLQEAWRRMAGEAGGWPEGEQSEQWLSDFAGGMPYVMELQLTARERITVLERAREAASRLGYWRGEGNALGNLGSAYADLGEPRRAIEYYEKALVIAREIGDRRGEGNSLGGLGSMYVLLGEPRRAIEYYEQYLAIAREIGDWRGEGNALGNLGSAYSLLGETWQAIEYHEQYLAIAREIGDRRGEGAALGNLGIAFKNLGEPRQAIEYHEQYLAIAREIGDRRGGGNCAG